MRIERLKQIVNAILGEGIYNECVEELKEYGIFQPDTKASQNGKTGPITQCYSCRKSCPATSCPFKGCGCYADNYPCNRWFDVASGMPYKGKIRAINPTELKAKLEKLKTTEIIRHNVSGDIARINSNDVNPALIVELMKAYEGHKPYTYTHCAKTINNLKIIKAACDCGFTINASCEKIDDVEMALMYGVPAVLTVESMPENTVVKNGVVYTRCPATIEGSCVQCKDCKMCMNKSRKNVVVFPIHGNQVEKIKQAGFLIKELK